MNTITRELLFDLLHSGECIVKFTKINGDLRTMPCTLNENLIPPSPVIEGKITKDKKPNPDVLSVWCLDKKAWRSFRIANVISIKIKNK